MFVFRLIVLDLFIDLRDQLGDAGIGFLVETELGRPSFRMEIREVPEKCRIIEKESRNSSSKIRANPSCIVLSSHLRISPGRVKMIS